MFKFLSLSILLFNFFPPQKVAAAGTLRESANIKLVLNHTKIVLHVK